MSEKNENSLLPSYLFPSFLRNFPLPFENSEFFPSQALQNTGLSVYEEKGEVIVEAALPGLDIKDIEVTFEKGILSVSGQKKEEEKNQDKDKKYFRKSSSSFSYKVALPVDIDEKAEPQATYKDGVMKIIFLKAKENKGKKISIKSGT
jgi:HSP20 family protein